MSMPELRQQQLRTQGWWALPTARGLEALYRACASDAAHVLVFNGNATGLRNLLNRPGSTPPQERQSHSVMEERHDLSLKDRCATRSFAAYPSSRRIDIADIDPHREFESWASTRSASRTGLIALNQSFGLSLSPTIFFEYPTIASFTEYLSQEHGAELARHFASTGAPIRERPSESRRELASAARHRSGSHRSGGRGFGGHPGPGGDHWHERLFPRRTRHREVLGKPARRPPEHRRDPEGSLGLAGDLRGSAGSEQDAHQVGRIHRGRAGVRSAVLRDLPLARPS